MAENIVLKIDEELEERLNSLSTSEDTPIKLLAEFLCVTMVEMEDINLSSKINVIGINNGLEDVEVPEDEKMRISFIRGFALGKAFGEYKKGSGYGL